MDKVVDDFLLAGDEDEVRRFHAAISKRFQVSQFTRSGTLFFYRVHIAQHENGKIELSMEKYMDTIHQPALSKQRRKEHDALASDEEIKDFLDLTVKMNFLGHGCLPISSFVANHLQQLIGYLKVLELKTANAALSEVRQLTPKLLFCAVPSSASAKYLAISYASQGKQSYGQTGYVPGILIQTFQRQSNMSSIGTVPISQGFHSHPSEPKF